MQTIAIVVGISHYKDRSYKPVAGARADADRFASALMSWGLPKEHIYLLTDEKATKTNIVKVFYDCQPFFDTDAKLIFYFAGHGIRENYLNQAIEESFLVCNDTQSENFPSTGFRLVELMQLLHILKPSQAFLFIDACKMKLNQIDNFFNDKEILSTYNSKGLFCMFSSGIHNSYEDVKIPHGYFTSALLKAFGEYRQDAQANCHDLARKVTATLQKKALPLPEIYHIGRENLWPLENIENVAAIRKIKQNDSLVTRWEAIGQLQDHLVSFPDPVIWMWGEGGMGKSVIAEQICATNASAVYATVPSGYTHSTLLIQALIDQIRTQKGELFFNRPPETSLYQVLSLIESEQPGTILLFDHLERLTEVDLKTLISDIDRTSLSIILISRNACKMELFNKRHSKVIEWLAIPLNLNEINQIAERSDLDSSVSDLLLNATKGNPLKVRQLLAKLQGQEIPKRKEATDEYMNCMHALAACGCFLDEHLFCKIFRVKLTTLASLEKLGLIRYTSGGCFPHDLLLEMVEESNCSLDIRKACRYWKQQLRYTPYKRSACLSMLTLASQLDDCTEFKKALAQCQQTLNLREYVNFLKDLIKIFQKHKWEDLLLKASDYLIDHEEYKYAGEVLEPLISSSNLAVRNHACKNNARRLVWLGQFGESIESNIAILKKCRSPQIVIPLKNNIGIAHFFSGNFETALQLFQDVICFKGKKDEREVGVAKLMVGLIATYRGENAIKAKELLECSLQIFETTKYYLWSIVSLNSLGDLSYRWQQWRQALYYLNKAVSIAEALQNQTFLLFTLKNIARVNLRLFGINNQELSLTVENLEMVLKEVLETGHNWVTVWAINVLGTIYAHRHEIDKLQKVMDVVAPLTEHYKECHIFTLSNLGHLAGLKGDEDIARAMYSKAFLMAKEVNNPFAIDEIKTDFTGIGLPSYLQPSEFVNI